MSIFFGAMDQIRYEDVVEFCEGKTREGITLDYKVDFPNELEKTLSAFANTLGGTVIIGVADDDGVPRLPVKGIKHVKGLQERVENIVLSNIYPPFIPQVQVCTPKDGNTFVVIRIEQSSIGPHAVNGRTGIYVRTGSVTSPDERASVDQIDWLRERRRKSEELRQAMVLTPDNHFQALCRLNQKRIAHGEVTMIFTPRYPHHAYCSARELPDKVREWQATSWKGRFVLSPWHQPTQGGIYRFHEDSLWHTEINQYGMVWHRAQLSFIPEVEPYESKKIRVVLISDLARVTDNFLEYCSFLARSIGLVGEFELTVKLSKLDNVQVKSGFKQGFAWEKGDTGSTPFPRTLELRVSLPVVALPVSAAGGDCTSVRYSQRDLLWPRLSSGTVDGSPARV